MKHAFKTAVLLPLALTGSMLIARRPQRQPPREQPPAEGQTQQDHQQQTITGKIAKLDNGQYVLVDSSGTVYQLDDQNAAQKFTGKSVSVSGTVDGKSNTIHVTEIKEAS
jgi:hypothetical protein